MESTRPLFLAAPIVVWRSSMRPPKSAATGSLSLGLSGSLAVGLSGSLALWAGWLSGILAAAWGQPLPRLAAPLGPREGSGHSDGFLLTGCGGGAGLLYRLLAARSWPHLHAPSAADTLGHGR